MSDESAWRCCEGLSLLCFRLLALEKPEAAAGQRVCCCGGSCPAACTGLSAGQRAHLALAGRRVLCGSGWHAAFSLGRRRLGQKQGGLGLMGTARYSRAPAAWAEATASYAASLLHGGGAIVCWSDAAACDECGCSQCRRGDTLLPIEEALASSSAGTATGLPAGATSECTTPLPGSAPLPASPASLEPALPGPPVVEGASGEGASPGSPGASVSADGRRSVPRAEAMQHPTLQWACTREAG
jgi:hypothetical protein